MNDGYVTSSEGRCQCKCPQGLTGSRCETTTTGNQYGCGGVVYLTGHTPFFFLRTPNYPSNYKSRLRCVWLVKVRLPVILPQRFYGYCGYLSSTKTFLSKYDLIAETSQCRHEKHFSKLTLYLYIYI